MPRRFHCSHRAILKQLFVSQLGSDDLKRLLADNFVVTDMLAEKIADDILKGK